MNSEPECRDTCAVCGKDRHPERSAKYASGQAELDSFCSTVCCRIYFGTTPPETPAQRAQKARYVKEMAA